MTQASRWFWAGVAAAVVGAGGLFVARDARSDVGFSYGDLREVTLRGRFVALQDELARKYGARITGGGPEKQWVLASPEGQYYTFLDTEGYRKLVAAGLSGKAVEVKARQFPRSMILEVQSWTPVAAETVQRQFHCAVCEITFTDFGPCACCGKEVKLVETK